jgi:hypothetical protein
MGTNTAVTKHTLGSICVLLDITIGQTPPRPDVHYLLHSLSVPPHASELLSLGFDVASPPAGNALLPYSVSTYILSVFNK